MEKLKSMDSKKSLIIFDIIQNYVQNVGLNWLYDKTQLHRNVVLACNVLTSFNEISMIQALLLQTGKYKLYLFLMYVILIA
jgi:hypothetical protein